MNDETSLSPLLFPKTSGTFGLTKNQCKKAVKVKHVRCDMKIKKVNFLITCSIYA